MFTRLSPLIAVYDPSQKAPVMRPGGLALAQYRSSAFGDGSHPTTRICAGAMDHFCRLQSPQAALDIGTGSGILARIARARGVPYVAGTDIDPIALEAAERNQLLDGNSSPIEFSSRSPESWPPSRFDLIAANILEGPLKSLAPSVAKLLSDRGILFLSGFTSLQIPPIEIAYQAQGLKVIQTSTLDDWVLLVLKRCK